MEDADEVEKLFDFEVSHISESEKIKLRLKKFCYIIGFLLILWVISIIIIVANNKDDPIQEKTIQKDKYYIMAEKFISNLTSTEIISLLNGINNIQSIKESGQKDLCEGQIGSFGNGNASFKGMCLQEGTTGVLYSNGTGIRWQSEINTAATFNKKLMLKIGKAQGKESKEKGINTLLSPCVNIMRKPKDGVLWESFGDDPFYSGICASEIIKGIQKSGVIAAIKHFLGNDEKEYEILNSSNTDINALMDIYVEPFYRAINDSEVRAIVVGNNTMNHTFCYENEYLLNNILREILNFKGFVISDLCDIYNNHSYNYSLLDLSIRKECAQGTFDKEDKNENFERNYSCWTPSEEEYMKNQTDIKERFKESAKKIIAAMYKMKQMKDYPEVNLFNKAQINETNRRQKLQKDAARESQVLLKNDGILPLETENQRIAVIGNIPLEFHLEYDFETIKSENFISPLPDIENLTKKRNIIVTSSSNLIDDFNNKKKKKYDTSALNKIKNELLNKNLRYDIAIIFITANSIGKYSIIDKNEKKEFDLSLWNGANELIEGIKNDMKVIVVISGPSFDKISWLNEVKAVLFSGFPGEGASLVIAEVLFGKVNPSGHLPFTWAEYNNLDSTISDEKFGKTWNDKFRYDGGDINGLKDARENNGMDNFTYPDGLYIGQRWFNKYNNSNKYIFPFGYGLSYTSFDYSELNLNISEKGLTIEFNVTNVGPRKGQAVPMIFLSFPIENYPKYIFKGFEKVKLDVNETNRVSIFVDDHALSYFNNNKYTRVNNGTIEVYIAENGNITDSTLNLSIEANYKND